MPLSDQQRAKLQALAKERGLDIDTLVTEAENIISMREKAPSGVKPSSDKPKTNEDPKPPANATSTPEQPKLFMYHLPFVTVNEVRTRWLGLEAWSADDGGEDVAAAFAAVNTGGATGEVTADSVGDIATRSEHRRSRKKRA